MSDDLRNRLVAAARELLEEPEVDSLDLREVARRAGKSRSAPYVAWGPKEHGGGIEALRIAVAASGFRDLAQQLRSALESAQEGRVLAHVGEEYFGFAQANPGLFRIMFGPEVARGLERLTGGAEVHPEVKHLLERRGEAQDAIHAAVETDLDRGADLGVGTRKAALSAWAMFHGAAVLLIDGQFAVENLTPEETQDLVVSYLLSEPVAGIVEAAGDLARAKIAKGTESSASGSPSTSSDVHVARLSSMAEVFTGSPPREMTEAQSSGVIRTLDERSRPPVAESPALRRLQRNARTLENASILWIDDHPDWSRHEEQMLTRVGAHIARAVDLDDALPLAETGPFDLILSDIARSGSDRAGIEDLPVLEKAFPGVPVVFYVGQVEAGEPPPAGSFGITNDPEELLHLVLDVLERRRP